MQRKPGYPVANCNIKMVNNQPDSVPLSEAVPCDDDGDQQQRRQQLINFGHAQWGFNNWSWTVNKQDLDFVDFANGKYCCGVAAFVCVSVKTFDIRRENVGYATCTAPLKGSAIHQARKCAVTNALRESLLSFGGGVATELLELLAPPPPPPPSPEHSPGLANKEPQNLPKNVRKEGEVNPVNMRPLPPAIKNVPPVPVALPPRPPAPPAAPPAPVAPRPPAPRPPSASNEGRVDPEEERAERRRRQRQAQEEFRLKQLMRQRTDDSSELKNGSSIDRLLMDIPTQDIVIEESGSKRKTPPPEGQSKRRGVSRLDIVETD